jgi:hypothetical protein
MRPPRARQPSLPRRLPLRCGPAAARPPPRRHPPDHELAVAPSLAADRDRRPAGLRPATVRRWIHRYNTHGVAGLADRPRAGRPRLGSPRLGERILRLLAEPTAWTIGRLYQRLGRPAMSPRTRHRRVREVAGWRRPRLVATGDPDPEQVLAELHQQLGQLPAGAVVLAEDETTSTCCPGCAPPGSQRPTPAGHDPGHQPAADDLRRGRSRQRPVPLPGLTCTVTRPKVTVYLQTTATGALIGAGRRAAARDDQTVDTSPPAAGMPSVPDHSAQVRSSNTTTCSAGRTQ